MRSPTAAVLIVLVAVVACSTESETIAVVSGRLVSGPHCPVETSPPDPRCAPRPVAAVVIVATRPEGEPVTSSSDEDGYFDLRLGAGLWTVTFPAVEGLMGIPEPTMVVVDTNAPVDMGEIRYDTGIR